MHELEEDLAATIAVLHKTTGSVASLISKIANHLLASGGKRLRPSLTLVAARLFGYAGHHHHLLAAAVECIHSATLLHDDVVDESGLRRGQPTANKLWDNKAPVLVGDFLFSRAFQLMVEAEHLPVLQLLAKAATVIAEGEVLQLSTTGNVHTTPEQYYQVITAKTAELFAAAAAAGGMVADAPPAMVDALYHYGQHLGIAFQLVDDVLDYQGDAAVMGKTAGDDFREGKVTLPLLFAYQAGDVVQKKQWQQWVQERHAEDFPQAVALLHQHQALEKTLEAAAQHTRQAIAQLAVLPPCPYFW